MSSTRKSMQGDGMNQRFRKTKGTSSSSNLSNRFRRKGLNSSRSNRSSTSRSKNPAYDVPDKLVDELPDESEQKTDTDLGANQIINMNLPLDEALPENVFSQIGGTFVDSNVPAAREIEVILRHTSKNYSGEDCLIELVSVPGNTEHTIAFILRAKQTETVVPE